MFWLSLTTVFKTILLLCNLDLESVTYFKPWILVLHQLNAKGILGGVLMIHSRDQQYGLWDDYGCPAGVSSDGPGGILGSSIFEFHFTNGIYCMFSGIISTDGTVHPPLWSQDTKGLLRHLTCWHAQLLVQSAVTCSLVETSSGLDRKGHAVANSSKCREVDWTQVICNKGLHFGHNTHLYIININIVIIITTIRKVRYQYHLIISVMCLIPMHWYTWTT